MSSPEQTLQEYREQRAKKLMSSQSSVGELYKEYQKDPQYFMKLVREHRNAREDIVIKNFKNKK